MIGTAIDEGLPADFGERKRQEEAMKVCIMSTAAIGLLFGAPANPAEKDLGRRKRPGARYVRVLREPTT